MPFTNAQKLQLAAMRRGMSGTGGVLMLGGFLLVWFTVPSTLPWWFGWVVIGTGVVALVLTLVLCFSPGFLCRPEPGEEAASKIDRAA